jgi:NADPH-dependent 2,4-dienoyl-CoA reductase/sulfur reductase-like enzyme
MSHGVVVIGAGQAGGRAIEALRGNGYAGPITLIGAETHLPYERPPLSKEMLLDPASTRIDWVRPEAWYEQNAVTRHLGVAATAIDRAARVVSLADGGTVAYDQLILATGTTPRRLTIPGGDHKACLAIRTLEDSERLRPFMAAGKHIAVIGAGFIGLECAAAARGHGAAVVVLEQGPRPMARGVPARIAALYADLHRAKGVDLRLGAQLVAIDGPEDAPVLHLADGQTIAADIVVVGIGVIAADQLASACGLEVDGGILVDAQGRTSDPSIWAAGDVTRHVNPLLGQRLRLESWQNAQNQAIAVARNIVGIETIYAEIPWFWSDQYGVNMQITGIAQEGATEVERGDVGACSGLLFQVQDGKLICAVGLNAARDLRFAKQIMQYGGAVDAAELADPGTRLADIAKRLKPS